MKVSVSFVEADSLFCARGHNKSSSICDIKGLTGNLVLIRLLYHLILCTYSTVPATVHFCSWQWGFRLVLRGEKLVTLLQ